MISLDIFVFGLLLTSTLTALVTEAIKIILAEHNARYRANTLAGIVALFLSVGVCIAYSNISGIGFNTQIVTCMVAQVFMSWLCAMVGYDKVIQAISQFKTNGEDE